MEKKDYFTLMQSRIHFRIFNEDLGENDIGYLQAYTEFKPGAEYCGRIDITGGVTIEKLGRVSSNVKIITHNHHMEKSDWRDGPIEKTSLLIREGAYIGPDAIILPKVGYIGKYSVIGAGAVVTKPVPDYEIWAGNPAKKVRDVECHIKTMHECPHCHGKEFIEKEFKNQIEDDTIFDNITSNCRHFSKLGITQDLICPYCSRTGKISEKEYCKYLFDQKYPPKKENLVERVYV